MSLYGRIPSFFDRLVVASVDPQPPVLRVEVTNEETGETKILLADCGEIKDGELRFYTDLEVIKSVEKLLLEEGLSVIPDPAAPVFTIMTPEQATIATKTFNLVEREI